VERGVRGACWRMQSSNNSCNHANLNKAERFRISQILLRNPQQHVTATRTTQGARRYYKSVRLY